MKTAIIYASVHHGNTKKIIDEIAKTNEVDLIENKNIFLMCTYGGSEAFKSMESIIEDKHDNLVGRFSCKGFDTFGPFKLIGGVAKGHPDDRDLAAAVEFYKKLIADELFADCVQVDCGSFAYKCTREQLDQQTLYR